MHASARISVPTSMRTSVRTSQLNSLLAARVEDGTWDVSRIGMVEVNNVCDGGPRLLAALRDKVAPR